MERARRIRLGIALLLAMGSQALAQEDMTQRSGDSDAATAPESPSPGFRPNAPSPDSGPLTKLLDGLLAPFSQEEDPDGPINTDRPTFTPANTVVPNGRFQIESGYTFTHDLTAFQRTNTHDFPELAVRVGLSKRVEFRTFWQGQTYSQVRDRQTGFTHNVNGPSDMEIGFKTQILRGDKSRPWIPTTALITSIMAPTGGSSPYSSETVEPNINLLYGWSLTEKLSLAGSTGYLGMRQKNMGSPADSFERFNQSIVAFYSVTERSTLFHEWYTFMYTNASDNRPTHFMDTGALYRPSPNTQLDVRAGMGLGDRPSDFFAGAGFSIRY